MIRKIHLLALFLAIGVFCSCNGQEKEKKLVRETFDNYKSAILTDQGEEAIKQVDSRTIKYYDKLVELIKQSDSTQLMSLPVLDKYMVLSIRHQTSKEDIVTFDGKKLFIYAIQNGMIGKNSVSNNALGEITVNTNFAKGELIVNGQKTPLFFHFYKEAGQWKIDLTSLFSFSTMAFNKMIEESGQSDTEFFFSILETLSGRKPGKEIWEKFE